MVGMVKEVILEWSRHSQDKKANAQVVEKLELTGTKIKYKTVRVD